MKNFRLRPSRSSKQPRAYRAQVQQRRRILTVSREEEEDEEEAPAQEEEFEVIGEKYSDRDQQDHHHPIAVRLEPGEFRKRRRRLRRRRVQKIRKETKGKKKGESRVAPRKSKKKAV